VWGWAAEQAGKGGRRGREGALLALTCGACVHACVLACGACVHACVLACMQARTHAWRWSACTHTRAHHQLRGWCAGQRRPQQPLARAGKGRMLLGVDAPWKGGACARGAGRQGSDGVVLGVLGYRLGFECLCTGREEHDRKERPDKKPDKKPCALGRPQLGRSSSPSQLPGRRGRDAGRGGHTDRVRPHPGPEVRRSHYNPRWRAAGGWVVGTVLLCARARAQMHVCAHTPPAPQLLFAGNPG